MSRGTIHQGQSVKVLQAGRQLVVTCGRAPSDVAFHTAVVDFFADAARLLGMPRSLAAIYGVIFASPRPLSFAEVEARVKLSKGSVSQGLRTLREIGAIKEVSAETDKAERFEPDLEMRKLIARYIENRLEKQMQAGRDRLANLNARLQAWPVAERKILSIRILRLQSWHRRSRKLLPLIKTFLKL